MNRRPCHSNEDITMQIDHLARVYRYDGIDLPQPPHLANDPQGCAPTTPPSTRRSSMPTWSMPGLLAVSTSPNIAALSAPRADMARSNSGHPRSTAHAAPWIENDHGDTSELSRPTCSKQAQALHAQIVLARAREDGPADPIAPPIGLSFHRSADLAGRSVRFSPIFR
jgi:hypothetical protein